MPFLRWLRELKALQLHKTHMQIENAPENQENIFIILTADGENAHNTNKCRNTLQMLITQPKIFYLQRVSFLVVLSAFAACVLSNRAVVLKLFQDEAHLCKVNYVVAPQKKTHDENILLQ